MKNTILSLAFLFMCGGLLAQTSSNVAQNVEALTAEYQLNQKQQDKMLEIQQRISRNMEQIEGLKKTDPETYIKKIQAMQQANMGHMEQLLNEDQLKIFRQEQMDLRQQKALLYKELKSAGKHQSEIEFKMAELDKEALLQS